MEVLHNGRLRRICQIFWPNKISNNDLHIKTGSWSITKEITYRRLRWLGLVLRMEQDRITKVPNRQKKTWEAKNLLAQNCETSAETDEPIIGRRPTCCLGPSGMESAHWSLISHRGRRVVVVEVYQSINLSIYSSPAIRPLIHLPFFLYKMCFCWIGLSMDLVLHPQPALFYIDVSHCLFSLFCTQAVVCPSVTCLT